LGKSLVSPYEFKHATKEMTNSLKTPRAMPGTKAPEQPTPQGGMRGEVGVFTIEIVVVE